jgi:hypothetical protein
MDMNDILDEIISGLQPEDVPVEYITMARVMDYDGNEKILKGKALADFLNDPDRPKMAEAHIILNVRKIKLAIMMEVNGFFKTIQPPKALPPPEK